MQNSAKYQANWLPSLPWEGDTHVTIFRVFLKILEKQNLMPVSSQRYAESLSNVPVGYT